MHILIVADEAKVAQALKEGLEHQGYEVTVAGTGEEGYYLLDARTFDLVVLDLMLPGRSGLEILATLRSVLLLGPGGAHRTTWRAAWIRAGSLGTSNGFGPGGQAARGMPIGKCSFGGGRREAGDAL